MKYLLALDQGTTASRAIVFDHGGNVRAMAIENYPQHYPSPGLVEHDADDIWATQIGTAVNALSRAGLTGRDLAGIGITNQRETTLLWDRKTGKPLHRAIVWQDRRTAPLCRELREAGNEEVIRERTGLLLDPYFSATKIRWLLDTVDGARQRAEDGALCCGTVDSWLMWKLTGGRVHATDVSNASRTLLFNIHTGGWDSDLLSLFGIPRAILPEVRDSSSVFGEVERNMFLDGVPIAGVAGDQQAALFGQICQSPGRAKNTYGTGCFLLMHTGTEARPSRHKLLSTVAWRIGGQMEYALEGSVFVAGAAIQWLRDELGLLDRSEDSERLAMSVPDTGGVYMVPAFTGLGAPHWDPHARGAILGLTRGTNKGHICRAALEALAYQSADVLECMQDDGGRELEELRVDGGASRNDFLMQFQADLLGVPVIRPKVTETTALGAAYLAGLATGYWETREELGDHWQQDRKFVPSRDPGEMKALRHGWRRAVERARNWVE